MAAKPRLLFLCQTLPYPPDGGVHIRSYNIMRLLSADYDITALCFYREATRPTRESVEAGLEGLQPVARPSAFAIPQEHSRLRLVWDHLRSLVTGRVYTVYAHQSRQFGSKVRELLSEESFDLVHMDSLDLSTYLPCFDAIPVVCTHHNIESALLRRRGRSEASRFRRWYLSHQAGLMESEERRWCERVDLNLVVSAADAELLSSECPDADVAVVPNGVDTRHFVPDPGEPEPALVFVGGFTWYPNRDGMEFFCDEVLPLVRREKGSIPVWWVGRAPEEARKHFAEAHDVHLTGYVDDIRPWVGRAACYIAPIRVGGGSRLKILDAWAMGKAVVSTSVGCEGLEAKDGENLLIADSPQAFAAAVCQILDDRPLRLHLQSAARATAESLYEWEQIGTKVRLLYREVLNGRTPESSTNSS